MKSKLRILDLAYIALMAALIAICTWISIPLPMVSFTLSTLGIFLSLTLLGGKRGSLAILVYILLGAMGVPVFSNFRGGLGALFGATGGYIFGFIFTAALYWLLTGLLGEKLPVQIVSLVIGLAVCYAVGTFWYLHVYVRDSGPMTLGAALMGCVVPFALPDLGKLALALFLGKRLRPFLK